LQQPGEAFAATLSAHVNVTPPRRLVPFLKGGVGLYRASVEAGRPGVPDFYRRRLDDGPSGLRRMQSFTDPALVLGGGASIFATRHFAIRPEIEAIVARRQAQSFVVAAASVRLVYHFEEHPVDLPRTK
jgi:hypothetical protein